MGKLTTLAFGRSQMAPCSFTGQPSFWLNTVKAFKARRNPAILTSLHWSLPGQQSAQLIWLTDLLDNHNLSKVIQMERTSNRLQVFVLPLMFPWSCQTMQSWGTSAIGKTAFRKGTAGQSRKLPVYCFEKTAVWWSFYFPWPPCTPTYSYLIIKFLRSCLLLHQQLNCQYRLKLGHLFQVNVMLFGWNAQMAETEKDNLGAHQFLRKT